MTEEEARRATARGLTPHQRIMDAARAGKGMRLKAHEVEELANDQAIIDAAADDDASCPSCGDHECDRAARRRANLCCECVAKEIPRRDGKDEQPCEACAYEEMARKGEVPTPRSHPYLFDPEFVRGEGVWPESGDVRHDDVVCPCGVGHRASVWRDERAGAEVCSCGVTHRASISCGCGRTLRMVSITRSFSSWEVRGGVTPRTVV